MSPEPTRLMAALEREVADGSLRWLADEHGYAVWSAEWPRLELRSLWTAIELGFGPGAREGAVELACRLTGVGQPVEHGVEATRAPVAGPQEVAAACAEVSTELAGPLRPVVSGDLSSLGLPGGQNAPHAEADRSTAGGLEAALSESEREQLLGALEGGLRRDAPWLWEEANLEVAERRWPTLVLASPKVELSLHVYGLQHGHPPPAISLSLVDPVEGELTGYELDELLDTGGALDRVLEATDPDAAASELGERLSLIRPLLAGDEEAWHALRRRRAEAGAARAADMDLHDGLVRAEAAFREGDLAAVVEALGELEGRLPRSAQLKLDYARKRLS